MKTLIGNNKYLYLKSEVESHYMNNMNEENKYLNNFEYYFKNLQNKRKEYLMLVVPNKSLLCSDNLPEIYDVNKRYRFTDFIKTKINSPNFVDLLDHANLDSSDYYITDSHINDKGSLKITKSIMKFFIDNDNEINKIDTFLEATPIHNFRGDLTSPVNLENQQLVTDLKLSEDILKINNICYNDYINKIKEIDVKYRFCYSRPFKYVYNKNAIIKKSILIYGDSTTFNKIFELISFYFENTFFCWNHLFINNELISMLNPNIIIEIKTERFLYISDNSYKQYSNYDSNYSLTTPLLSYDDIYNILLHINRNTFNNIINNINNINEIKKNTEIFSYILCQYRDLIKPYIKKNINDILNLNRDLLIFYDNKTDIEISDLTLINFINNAKESRKYKYENIPEDFNVSIYKELNGDLQHMTDIEATTHYEYDGYKTNRKYKYENIPEDFNVSIYKELNGDLQHMTDIEAKIHYGYDGYKENRKYKYENIPEDFVAKDYIELNEDLQHMTDIEAKIHYGYDGYKENRKYKYENIPEDFVAKDYKELNEDLQHMTEIEAKIHYEYDGYKENRNYYIVQK